MPDCVEAAGNERISYKITEGISLWVCLFLYGILLKSVYRLILHETSKRHEIVIVVLDWLKAIFFREDGTE